MFHKYLNISTGKTFIVGERSKEHYKENTNVKYIGSCNEDGAMIRFENSEPIQIPKLEKEVKKQIKNSLPKKSHKIEEDFETSDERDSDS